jgi:hypothetical protein
MKHRLIDELEPGFTERSERGKKNRAKGVTFERTFAKSIRDIWPNAKRLFGQAREGDECPDVGGTPFWLELGNGKLALHVKLLQAMSDSKSCPNEQYQGLPPVAVVNRPGIPEPIVGLPLSLFLELVRDPKSLALALGRYHGQNAQRARGRSRSAPRPVRAGKP